VPTTIDITTDDDLLIAYRLARSIASTVERGYQDPDLALEEISRMIDETIELIGHVHRSGQRSRDEQVVLNRPEELLSAFESGYFALVERLLASTEDDEIEEAK